MGEKIFCHAAVKVAVTSHTSGTQVIHMYFAPCILSSMVVATQSAIPASNWLEIPNSGHSELMPPNGSRTPCTRKYPHPPTTAADVSKTPGIQLVRPSE